MKTVASLFTILFFGIISLSAQVSVVSVVDNNYVFKGVSNELVIMVEQIPCNEITVLSSVGTVTTNGCKSVLKMPTKTPQNEAEIKLVHQDRVIERYMLELRDLPKPKAVLGTDKNRLGGIFTSDELSELDGLKILTEYPKFEFEITDFKLIAADETYGSRSHIFTKEQQAALKKLEPGERIIFEDIYAKGPNGALYRLNDILVKVK